MTSINDTIVSIDDLKLNPLGYALYLGRVDCFEYLLNIANASLVEMEKYLKISGTSGLNLLCQLGNIEIL